MENKIVTNDQSGTNQDAGTQYEHKADESFKSKALKWVVWAMRMKGNPKMKKKLESGLNAAHEQPEPTQSIMKNFNVTTALIDGRNVFTIEPKENKAQRHVLYIHGGAYVFNTSAHQWGLIENLVRETNCTFIVPDYPMAPQHTYVDAYKFMESVYKKVISEVNPKDLIFLGDSSGGGFVLGLAQKIKQDGLALPSQVIMLAPWLDITCSNPEIKEIDKDDVLSSVDNLKMAAEAFTKGGDINHHLVCPIHGPLEGLPKLSLFIGTHDIFYADAKKFKALCEQKGVPLNYYVYPKMGHVWMVMGIAEAEHAVQQIKELILS